MLRGKARRIDETHDLHQLLGLIPGLLAQLAYGDIMRTLVGIQGVAGRYFQGPAMRRQAVLLDQGDAAVISQSDDTDRVAIVLFDDEAFKMPNF